MRRRGEARDQLTRDRDDAGISEELEDADTSVRGSEVVESEAKERRGPFAVAAAAVEDEGAQNGGRRPTAPRAAGVGMAATRYELRLRDGR